MPIDNISLPSQIIIPTGAALVHAMLCLYVLFRLKLRGMVDILLVAYLMLAILWNVNNVLAASPLTMYLWELAARYGLVFLGLAFWAYGRAFLHGNWRWLRLVMTVGGLGLAAAIMADVGWLSLVVDLPMEAGDLARVICGAVWAFLTTLVALDTLFFQNQIQSPDHRNRVYYLFISTILLMMGYGLYLSLPAPLWTFGLIVTSLGGLMLTYLTVAEDLADLDTAIRRSIRVGVVTTVTVCAYVVSIYLVQLFLGDLIAAIPGSQLFDPIFVVAVAASVLLTIVYAPLRQTTAQLLNWLLFDQRLDPQVVIRGYSQVVSNQLYLAELVPSALRQIHDALSLSRVALFIVEEDSDATIVFSTFPSSDAKDLPRAFSLAKDTPITTRLLTERQALSQYSMDISKQFEAAPADDLATMKALNMDWFVPIVRQNQPVGLFGLGPKRSGKSFTLADLSLLSTLADQTALALENATLFDRVQRNLDEITNMKNLMGNTFDSMASAVIAVDIPGTITLMNWAAEAILAVSSRDCLGKSYREVLHLSNTPVRTLIENVIEKETSYFNYEVVTDIPSRGTVTLTLNIAPLRNSRRQVQGVTVVMEDITETKHLRGVQDMFRRYVSPAVVDRLPAHPSDLQLGGNRREITVLFADIRGFTRFSEPLEPEELVDTLNVYLSMAGRAILSYEGLLDKFVGDAVMGIFNAPLEQPNHALLAAQAAIAMQTAIAEYHAEIGEPDRQLQFGVGLHVGDAVVGNVGLTDRMDYTAIGDTVNVAKRIQENTPGGKILMSDAVYALVKDSVEGLYHAELTFKGRVQPMATYELCF